MAVYTDISDKDLDALTARYDIGAVRSLKGIAEGVENSNFLVTTDQHKYIFTIYEKRVHKEDLPFFLSLMEHLAEKGLPCPVPIHQKDNQIMMEIQGKPAVLISFLEGLSPKTLQPYHCYEVGVMLAKLHQAGAEFSMQRKNAMAVEGWKSLFADVKDKVDTLEQGLAVMIQDALATLEASWPINLPSGIIHADLFPDNVFFEDKTLTGMIDFYFACNDFLAYDLAITLNAWCFEPDGSFNYTKAAELFKGYETVQPLTDNEKEVFPILARGAAMRFLLSRLFDWFNPVAGALVTQKDPREYLTKYRFHDQIKTFEEYDYG